MWASPLQKQSGHSAGNARTLRAHGSCATSGCDSLMCVCVCVCVCAPARARDFERAGVYQQDLLFLFKILFVYVFLAVLRFLALQAFSSCSGPE